MDTRCPISSRPGQRYERIPTWTTTTRTDFVTRVYEFPVDTGLSTPDGGSDWENWKLASKLLPSGTAVSLWSPSTGALYLWEGVTFDIDSGRLLYTQYRLLANFLTGATNTTLRLTDFDANGVPDLGRLGGRFPYGVPDQRPVRDRDRDDQGQGPAVAGVTHEMPCTRLRVVAEPGLAWPDRPARQPAGDNGRWTVT